MAEEEKVRELAWDEVIDDGEGYPERVVFEPGDYDFTVKSFERGKAKDTGRNMAILDLEVTDGSKKSVVRDWIVLTNKTYWKAANYFRSVGMKKHGEDIKMDWKGSIGKTGRCTLIKEEKISKKGNPYDVNYVYNYNDPIEEVEDYEW